MPFLSWLRASIAPLIGLVSFALCAEVAQAENLHRKYGPGWDCRNLHPSLGDDVFKTCKKCESENQEFDLDGSVGKCVPKPDRTDDKTPPVDTAKKTKPVPEEVYVEGAGQCGQPEAADKTCLWNGINCYRWGGPKIAGWQQLFTPGACDGQPKREFLRLCAHFQADGNLTPHCPGGSAIQKSTEFVEGAGTCGKPEANDQTCLWNGRNCYRWNGQGWAQLFAPDACLEAAMRNFIRNCEIIGRNGYQLPNCPTADNLQRPPYSLAKLTEDRPKACADWHAGAKIDEIANYDQRRNRGTCSVRDLTREQCSRIGGSHFKPDHGSGFTECFGAPGSGELAQPPDRTPEKLKAAAAQADAERCSRHVRDFAILAENVAVGGMSFKRTAEDDERFRKLYLAISGSPACRETCTYDRRCRGPFAQAGEVVVVKLAGEERCVAMPRYEAPSDATIVEKAADVPQQCKGQIEAREARAPSVRTPDVRVSDVKPPTVTPPNVRGPTPPTVTPPKAAANGPGTVKSCADWHSGARVDEIANFDQRQNRDTCSVRNLTRAECAAIGGKHFKEDHGSGFTECFSAARSDEPAPRPPAGWRHTGPANPPNVTPPAVATPNVKITVPTVAKTCADWQAGARVDEIANTDQRQTRGTCSIRNVTAQACKDIGGTKFKPNHGSGFTECFRNLTANPLGPAPTRPTANPPRTAAPNVSAAAPKTPQPSANAAPPAMSAQCQKLVGDYVAAAQAKDGARALAGYNALKRAGGCGVLAKVDRPAPKAPPANDPRFVARGATPLTDDVVGRCDASPAECAARARQLEAGASPAAAAALYMHAISVGLNLGAQMGSGVMMAVPQVRTPAPNMNSVGPGAVRNTVGQGSPTRPAPRTRPSDITGTKN